MISLVVIISSESHAYLLQFLKLWRTLCKFNICGKFCFK